MQTKKITLKTPIQNGTEEIKELVVRKPKARDLRRLPGNPKTGDILDLAGGLVGHPPSVIDELDIEDTMALLEAVTDFLPGIQRTGEAG